MPCEKQLSQKHDPPPEKENDTRDKDRIETQSPPKRTHGITVKKKQPNKFKNHDAKCWLCI